MGLRPGIVFTVAVVAPAAPPDSVLAASAQLALRSWAEPASHRASHSGCSAADVPSVTAVRGATAGAAWGRLKAWQPRRSAERIPGLAAPFVAATSAVAFVAFLTGTRGRRSRVFDSARSARKCSSGADFCSREGGSAGSQQRLPYGLRPPDNMEEGCIEGWSKIDELFRPVLGKITLVTSESNLPGGISAADNEIAVVDLVLAQAVHLAMQQRWHFQLLFDEESCEAHYARLQQFVSDVPWIFERFSIDSPGTGFRVPDVFLESCVDYDSGGGLPRGIILVQSGPDATAMKSKDQAREDALNTQRLVRSKGVHFCVVRHPRSSSGKPPDPGLVNLEGICDVHVTARALKQVAACEARIKKASRGCSASVGTKTTVHVPYLRRSRHA
mmetsp:Transcript_22005/g.48640  ORF Transcript_22005/g.48640 Transcript_22005/m.48640 type:complete len:387 (-) Transcript_22005:171-1331(-)